MARALDRLAEVALEGLLVEHSSERGELGSETGGGIERAASASSARAPSSRPAAA